MIKLISGESTFLIALAESEIPLDQSLTQISTKPADFSIDKNAAELSIWEHVLVQTKDLIMPIWGHVLNFFKPRQELKLTFQSLHELYQVEFDNEMKGFVDDGQDLSLFQMLQRLNLLFPLSIDFYEIYMLSSQVFQVVFCIIKTCKRL